jgi:hypothetical protein
VAEQELEYGTWGGEIRAEFTCIEATVRYDERSPSDDSIADQVTSQPVNSSFDSGSAMVRLTALPRRGSDCSQAVRRGDYVGNRGMRKCATRA